MKNENHKQDGDYGYICIYNDKQIEVYAANKVTAVNLARDYFKPPKSKQHLVGVYLAERPDGSEVIQSPT